MMNASELARPAGHSYTYQAALAASEGIRWRVEDIIGGDRRLDFTRPFMPESFARVNDLGFLSPDERLKLNQIRGNTYLCIFGLVEEFILPFVLDHARPQLQEDDYRVRALLQFASEEAKHIQLFKRFREEFEAGFGTRCEVIGPPEAIAEAVLAHDPLAVTLAILQIEWMSQRHYVESIRDDQRLDPQFKSLLRHHWMEEAQHAKLDTLMVESVAQTMSEQEIQQGIDDYLAIGGMLDGGLAAQTDLDLASFARASGRTLSDREAACYRRVQQRSYRQTFLTSGMRHERFQSILTAISPEGAKKVAGVAPVLVPEETNAPVYGAGGRRSSLC